MIRFHSEMHYSAPPHRAWLVLRQNGHIEEMALMAWRAHPQTQVLGDWSLRCLSVLSGEMSDRTSRKHWTAIVLTCQSKVSAQSLQKGRHDWVLDLRRQRTQSITATVWWPLVRDLPESKRHEPKFSREIAFSFLAIILNWQVPNWNTSLVILKKGERNHESCKQPKKKTCESR